MIKKLFPRRRDDSGTQRNRVPAWKDRTMKFKILLTFLFMTSLFVMLPPATAIAEKAPYTKKQLEAVATHIVVGKVQAIYMRRERNGNYEYVHKLAEVKIKNLEKGKGPAGLVYIRYFDRNWKGQGVVPPGGGSYYPQPKEGRTYRFYLARNAYDGWSLQGPQDGGYNVVYVNGIQPLEP